MITNYAYSELLMTPGTFKNIVITDAEVVVSGSTYTAPGSTVILTNDVIHSDSFELTQSLCSDSHLIFGSCEVAECKFTMSENIASLKGKRMYVYLYLNGNAATMLQLGIFTVESDKLSSDRTRREVTMYDDMYKILNSDVAEWYNRFFQNAGPNGTNVDLMAHSLLDEFDIEVNTTGLVNGSMAVTRAINPETLSGADVIKALCEVNGAFGRIDRFGTFQFIVLSEGIDSGQFPSDTLYPRNNLYPESPNPNTSELAKNYYTSVQFEDYMAEGITKLVIRVNDDDAGTAFGTEGNTYIISGNMLLIGQAGSSLQTSGNNILSCIKNRYYKPCEVEAVGNPLHEPGDAIRVRTMYRGIVTYVLERTLKGIQHMTDTYKAQGEEEYTQELNSISSQYKELSGKVTSLKVDTAGIEGRVEDIEDGSASVIQQLSNSISAKVSSTGGVASSFAYELTDSKFKLVSNGNTVFECDSDGVEVRGTIGAIGSDTKIATMTENGLVVEDAGGLGTENIRYGSDRITVNGVGSHAGTTSPFLWVEWVAGQTFPNLLVRCDKLNNATPITSSNVGSYAISNGSSSGIESTSGTGLALNAPNYSGWVHVGYSSDAVTIGNASNTIRIGGKKVKWQTITDASGNTFQALVADT